MRPSTIAAAVTEHVLSAPWYLSAKRLSCYISMSRAELRTDAIITHALSAGQSRAMLSAFWHPLRIKGAGKTVFVPFCPPEPRSDMRMLRLRDESTFAAMKENRWGIREFSSEQIVGLEEGEPLFKTFSVSQGSLLVELSPRS